MGSDKLANVTDASFDSEVLKSSQPVLIDFWATWCPPCRAIAPVVEALAGEYAGRVKVGKYDVDCDGAIPQRFRISAIPTMIFFKDGKVVDQIVGAAPKDLLKQKFDSVLAR